MVNKNKKNDLNTNKSNEIFIISSSEKCVDNVEKSSKNDCAPASFEEAVEATGFGKYNLMLLLIGLPAAVSSQFDTTGISYVSPIAQCDLELTLEDKGVLNAITYAGMISGAIIWGYLADTIGRKKLLIYGFFLDGFFVLLGGLSQKYTMLVITKFITGFIINGPFAALLSYLSEFHCAKYRTPIPLLMGTIHSMGSIILPLLGWLIFTEEINLRFFSDFLIIRSWNVYLLVCSLPSLISGFVFIFLPESPKFLMTTGRNEQTYEVFQTVYAWNTGKPKETYPIKALVDEISMQETEKYGGNITANRTKIQALKEGWHQITPLFHPPYLGKMLMVFAIQFTMVLGLNSLRLWLPQIFTAMNDYHTLHDNDEDANMCKMLEMVNLSQSSQIDDNCFVNYNNSAVYTNNIILSSATLVISLISMFVVGRIKKKQAIIASGLVAGISGLCIYFAKNEAAVVALTSIFAGFSGVACNLVVGVVVDLFPTTLRTMTVTLTMTSGRTGAVVGNLIFPFLLSCGCLPPFLTIGCLSLGGTFLTLLLPKTDMKALE